MVSEKIWKELARLSAETLRCLAAERDSLKRQLELLDDSVADALKKRDAAEERANIAEAKVTAVRDIIRRLRDNDAARTGNLVRLPMLQALDKIEKVL